MGVVMLYRILFISAGLLASTAISSSFAGKVDNPPQEKGTVGARIAKFNQAAAPKPQEQPLFRKKTVTEQRPPSPSVTSLQATLKRGDNKLFQQNTPPQRTIPQVVRTTTPTPVLVLPQNQQSPSLVAAKPAAKDFQSQVGKRPLPTPSVKVSSPQPAATLRQHNTPARTRPLANYQGQVREEDQTKTLGRTLPTPPTAKTPSPSLRPVQTSAASDPKNAGKPFQKLNVAENQVQPSKDQSTRRTVRQEPTVSTVNGLTFNSKSFVEESLKGRNFSFLKTNARGLEGWSQDEKALILSGRGLERPPTGLGQFKNLEALFLNSNNLTTLSREMMGELQNLQGLFLPNNKLRSLDTKIGEFQKLRALDLTQNELTQLPGELSFLKNLEGLWLGNNKLTYLPAEIGNLNQLEILNISNNQLVRLPDSFKNLKSLERLHIEKNPNLRNLSEALSNLSSLTHLYVDAGVILPPSLLEKEAKGQLKIKRF